MSLFESVQKKHVLKAIEELDRTSSAGFPESKYYDVLHAGKRYPPKPLMALAEMFSSGQNIKTTDFSGGVGTPAFNKLTSLGFNIVKKDSENSFTPYLLEFLEQANTDNLKTRKYISDYRGLKVKVSFGQGNAARIPWISFLGQGQTTSNGFYPVYLYYKKENKLILAYGISETNSPSKNWNIKHKVTIKQKFSDVGVNPERYGDSYVFKEYDINSLPDHETLSSDLNEIIRAYKMILESTFQNTLEFDQSSFDFHPFIKDQSSAGLHFKLHQNIRFIASLLTKPFVILTGLAGSGKTKLAQSFVEWISQSQEQFELVPVGADWTNREPLLGFPNSLDPTDYIFPDSKVLQLILRAVDNPELPFFLILDEMNLSHVERYFADFLSVMESNDKIHLHSSDNCEKVPKSVPLPKNLFIIGTVNIDETTYMFSPKVLDRANTLEFRVTVEEMSGFLEENGNIDMSKLTSNGANMAFSFVQKSKIKATVSDGYTKEVLLNFFKVLQKAGAEFGYRTANEIQLLIRMLVSLDAELSKNELLDIAIMQKLLPKLHGSRRKLEESLRALCGLCLTINEPSKVEDYLTGKVMELSNEEVLYPISLNKIQRMYQASVDHGFASYAEA